MTAAVIVALIALVGTVANVGMTYMLTVRSERQRAIHRADAQWLRVLSSLEQAAEDLRSRIGNIVRGGFLDAYGADIIRTDEAVRSTGFRFAQYFAWSEVFRRALRDIDPRHEAEARELERLQAKICRTFASDHDYGPGYFMVWREAQRAIGELMISKESDVVDTVGVAGFVDQLDRMKPWMNGIMEAMTCAGPSEWPAGDRQRLSEIGTQLSELAAAASRSGARKASPHRLDRSTELRG